MPLQIPGFDTVDTLERLAGDVDLYHRILEMLVPTLVTALEQFNAALSTANHSGTIAAVHSIRGMAANVGATDLFHNATKLETLLKEHRALPEQLTAFRTVIEETLRVVKACLDQRKAGALV